MMQEIERSERYWPLVRILFWILVPSAVLLIGLYHHRRWLAMFGLLLFIGTMIESAGWSDKTRRAVVTPLAIIAGPAALASGLVNHYWGRTIIGALLSIIAIGNSVEFWRERRRTGTPDTGYGA